MAVITIIGCGMMGSAISWPAAHNGHTIRYVGTPLDGAIIDHARKTREHLTLKRPFPSGQLSFYLFEEIESALAGTDLFLCGVSSFGLDWFLDTVIPMLPDNAVVPLHHQGHDHLCGRRDDFLSRGDGAARRSPGQAQYSL